MQGAIHFHAGKLYVLAWTVISVLFAAGPVFAAPYDGNPGKVRVLVVAESDSVLSAQMTGKIVTINAKLGEHAKKGDVLLHFDCDEQEARLNMAKAELDGAQHVLDAKNKLLSLNSASTLEVSQAEAEVGKFQAQIQLYQAQLRLCNITAPFSGRITNLRAKLFESVAVGQPLVEVVSEERLKVRLNIPSIWLSHVKVKQPFSVFIDETRNTYQARVRRINGKVDAVSQSIEIEGEMLGQTDDLLPGMSGTANFPEK